MSIDVVAVSEFVASLLASLFASEGTLPWTLSLGAPVT